MGYPSSQCRAAAAGGGGQEQGGEGPGAWLRALVAPPLGVSGVIRLLRQGGSLFDPFLRSVQIRG